MRPLKLGFIGGSVESAVGRAHFSACRMDGRFEVSAGCFSRDPEINAASGSQYGCKAVPPTDRIADLLACDIDAVVVLTPTPSHIVPVRAALSAGIPVICEKALAHSVIDSAGLLDLRAKEDGFLAVTYNYTGYPMVRELRDMVEAGELGKIVSIQAEMPQEGYLRDGANPQKWRQEDGSIPAVHLDLGTHLHHMIYFLTGADPDSLVATHSSSSRFKVVDDVHCIAEYSNDFNASIWFGKTALGHRNGLRVRVNGTKAAAEWQQTNPEELQVAHADGRRETLDRSSPTCVVAREARYQRFKVGHPAGFIEAYANLYGDIDDALRARRNGMPRPPLAEMYTAEVAHEGLLMMERMVESHKEGSWK